MNIPDKAVEVVARNLALLDEGDEWPTNEALGGSLTGTRDDEFRAGMEDHARELLELAAPFIAAQALRDAASNITSGDWATYSGFGPGIRWSAEDIRQRADELDRQ